VLNLVLGQVRKVIVTEIIRSVLFKRDGRLRILRVRRIVFLRLYLYYTTGCRHVIRRAHMDKMKDHAIVGNNWSFDHEIDVVQFNDDYSDQTVRTSNHNFDKFTWAYGNRFFS